MDRRKFLALAAGGAAAITQFGRSTEAFAEQQLRYDPTSGQWVPAPRRSIVNRKPPAKFRRRTVRAIHNLKPGTIVIHTDKKFLYYVLDDKRAIRYGVGVGREGFTWKGNASIQRKAKWPSWTPPAEMRAREAKKGIKLPVTQAGGIDNPLGARALYLYRNGRDTLYRIHGTNQPWSIGLNLSSGCIRLNNKDVEHLYERVKIGAKVIVIGQGQNGNGVLRERTLFGA